MLSALKLMEGVVVKYISPAVGDVKGVKGEALIPRRWSVEMGLPPPHFLALLLAEGRLLGLGS